MINTEESELQAIIDRHLFRPSKINWYLLDAGIRDNPDYRNHANVLVLLDMIAPRISPDRKRYASHREGWLNSVNNETKATRYFMDMFKDNRFVGDMLLGVGSETQKPIIGPTEFVRLLGWGRCVNDPVEFYRYVIWLLQEATIIEIERKYELGTDITFQFALGFVRGMKVGKPNWVTYFPLQGPRLIDEYFVRHLEPVEKVEDTTGETKHVFSKAPLRVPVDAYFQPTLGESCEIFHYHRCGEGEMVVVVQSADGVGSNHMQVELEFTKLNGGQEVRLFIGEQPSNFGRSLEMTQFKVNPELLNLMLRVALANRLQVELLLEPTYVPFAELTGNVFIPNAEFSPSGFPKLY